MRSWAGILSHWGGGPPPVAPRRCVTSVRSETSALTERPLRFLLWSRRMNRSEHPHFNPWLALVVVCFGQFMVVLDATIVNVALPAIQGDLGFSDSSLQWVVNAYTLFFGGFLLLGGRAADLLGRRSLFIAGVAVFSLASLANGLA